MEARKRLARHTGQEANGRLQALAAIFGATLRTERNAAVAAAVAAVLLLAPCHLYK